jgi:histidine triad (HIT) family protein
MEDCIFCKIIRREAPGFIIGENEAVIVFLSLENHPLVVTKVHHRDIYGMDAALGGAVMAAAIRVARALKRGLGCDGVLLRQANEAAAGQDVFHFHLHVIPRWTGRRKPATDDANKQAMLETIKAALE